MQHYQWDCEVKQLGDFQGQCNLRQSHCNIRFAAVDCKGLTIGNVHGVVQVVGASVLLFVMGRSSALTPSLTTWPGLDDIKTFAKTMGPLSVTYICKNLCYILLQTAAASLSLVQLAAHQVGLVSWTLSRILVLHHTWRSADDVVCCTAAGGLLISLLKRWLMIVMNVCSCC